MDSNESQSNQNFVLLMSSHDSSQVHFVHGLLESNGLGVFIDTKGIGLVTGEMDGPFTKCNIFVHEQDVADAKKLLESHEVKYEEDSEWKKDLSESQKKHRVFGRILGLLVTCIFGVLSYLSFRTSEDFMGYVLLGCSLLFCLVLVFSYDWSKEH